jgi:hypothetical protein
MGARAGYVRVEIPRKYGEFLIAIGCAKTPVKEFHSSHAFHESPKFFGTLGAIIAPDAQ